MAQNCSGKDALEFIKNLKAFNTGKTYTLRGVIVDRQYVTKEVTAYLNDPIIHSDVIQLVISDRENGEEILIFNSPNII